MKEVILSKGESGMNAPVVRGAEQVQIGEKCAETEHLQYGAARRSPGLQRLKG